jgi:hypothetical protein
MYVGDLQTLYDNGAFASRTRPRGATSTAGDLRSIRSALLPTLRNIPADASRTSDTIVAPHCDNERFEGAIAKLQPVLIAGGTVPTGPGALTRSPSFGWGVKISCFVSKALLCALATMAFVVAESSVGVRLKIQR